MMKHDSIKNFKIQFDETISRANNRKGEELKETVEHVVSNLS